MEDFFKQCEKNQGIAIPKSLTGKAITYALGLKKSLVAFLNDPRFELTNNAAERAIKPFAIGRKNWLFANTEKGAQAAAVIYSVVETAKAAGKKPFDFLRCIFEKLRSCDFGSFVIFNWVGGGRCFGKCFLYFIIPALWFNRWAGLTDTNCGIK